MQVNYMQLGGYWGNLRADNIDVTPGEDNNTFILVGRNGDDIVCAASHVTYFQFVPTNTENSS